MESINQQYEEIIDEIVGRDFAVFENLFDESTLKGLKKLLLQKIEGDELKEAGIGKQSNFIHNQAVRSDKIQWIDPDSANEFEQEFNRKILDLSNYLNKTCYAGISGSEFHYACFETGTFYKRHFDRFTNDSARKFSVITYLNCDWKEGDGGELVLYLNDAELKIKPEWGRTVIFRSHLIEHEVLVSLKKRLSVTGWLR